MKQLELHEDMRHQRREWLAEHIGWVAMGIVLASALAGLLGPGPFSRQRAGQDQSTLWVDYPQVARYQAPTEMKVHFQISDSPQVAVSVNRDFYEVVEPEISPEPERVEAGVEEMKFIFGVTPSSGPSAVTFRIKPTERGLHEVRIGLDQAHRVKFHILILP